MDISGTMCAGARAVRAEKAAAFCRNLLELAPFDFRSE